MAVALGPPLVALRYAMYFWFMHDAVFAHNGLGDVKERILKMTQQGATRIWHRGVILKLSHQQQQQNGEESAVYDCIANNSI